MDLGIFIPSVSSFDNQIPEAHRRKNAVFWSFLQPVLGLQPEHLPWHNEGVSPNIARIREYEARRAEANNSMMPTVTLGDLASDAIEHVKEAVKRVTKTDKAKAWLADILREGPVSQSEIEAKGLEQGYNLKLLKVAQKRLKAVSSRKNRAKWAWMLPFTKAGKK